MKFHRIELKQILHFANYTIEDSLHWGDGAAYFPHEDRLLKKIVPLPDTIDLSDEEIDTIYTWTQNYIGGGTLLMGEDIIIMKKLYHYYKKKYKQTKDSRINEKLDYLKRLI